MAQTVKEYSERTVDNETNGDNRNNTTDGPEIVTVLQRVIYFIGGVIIVLIGLRMLLSLLGANRMNEFANFIYSVSYPFVAPFFGLFNYDMQYGVSRFEFESLIAIIVWALLTVGLAKLVSIGSNRQEV